MALTDIDHQVNAYFQRIFSTPRSDEVLNIFIRLNASPVPRHKETVCCMLKHLIKEFHLFPSYPKNDLFKMAHFLGGFVEHRLILDKNTLNTIIGYIFYDLKSVYNANAFNFSYIAINRFKKQLKNFPKYCYRLQKIDKFENFSQDLIEYIKYGSKGLHPPSQQVISEKSLSPNDNNEEVKESRSQDTVIYTRLPILESPVIAQVAGVLPRPEPPVIAVVDDVSSVPEPPVIAKVAGLLSRPEPPVIAAVADVFPVPEPPVIAKVTGLLSRPEPPVIAAVADVFPVPKTLVITKVTDLLSRPEPPVIAAVVDVFPVPESPVITKVTGVLSIPEPPVIAAVTEVKIIVPPKIIQGEIRFIINSLSKENLQIKCRGIKGIITKEHLPWLSKYIVTKRVRHEFNFHDLYSNVLDCLNSKLLNSLVLSDTIKKIKILLRRNVGIPSVADKWLIKNLGHWLGVITLAKNRSVSKEDLDLEDLLADAYDKGDEELLFVVQLVTNTLESCSGGTFGPNNPWTDSLINCLFKLYKKPNTKLQVKVEIEKLCKVLNMKLNVKDL